MKTKVVTTNPITQETVPLGQKQAIHKQYASSQAGKKKGQSFAIAMLIAYALILILIGLIVLENWTVA